MLTLSAIAWAKAHNIASESVLTLPVQNELSRFDFKESLNAFYVMSPILRHYKYRSLISDFQLLQSKLAVLVLYANLLSRLSV